LNDPVFQSFLSGAMILQDVVVSAGFAAAEATSLTSLVGDVGSFLHGFNNSILKDATLNLVDIGSPNNVSSADLYEKGQFKGHIFMFFAGQMTAFGGSNITRGSLSATALSGGTSS